MKIKSINPATEEILGQVDIADKKMFLIL